MGGVFSGARMREGGCQKRLVFIMTCKSSYNAWRSKKLRSCPPQTYIAIYITNNTLCNIN
jgi:hypothetical protein